MLTEIIPGRTYRRRDGEIVIADVTHYREEIDANCVLVRREDRSADPWLRWRRNGDQRGRVFDTCLNEMIAGQVPRMKRKNSDNTEREKYDLVECISHPEIELKQQELFE